MPDYKKRLGDRRDGRLIRELDSLHFTLAVIYPNRADNEAYISHQVDLTNIKKYIEKKNETEKEFPYTFFHIIVAALLKTLVLRPKLNIFICNENYYMRDDISAAFVVKKKFDDNGEESLAVVHAHNDDTLESIHKEIYRQITFHRSGEQNSTGDALEIVNKIPRFISKTFIHFMRRLDKLGKVPKSLVADDPGYSSVFISNLGSIKLKCGYHHLANWGTTSLFCIVGEKKWTPVYDENGFVCMRETLDLGLTVDERIADGYYYARSVALLKKLLENPELLEKQFSEEVDY